MFCPKCGYEVESDWKACPNCGLSLHKIRNNKQVSEGRAKDDRCPSKYRSHTQRKPKRNNIKVIAIAGGILIVVFIAILLIMDLLSDKKELVKTGYLGDYDTVEVQEILEWYAPDGDWGEGESKSSDKYIVEYKAEDFVIQFSLDDDEKAFKVTGLQDEGEVISEPASVKWSLDAIYEGYSMEYPEAGIEVNTGFDCDTLQGHLGPVKKKSKKNVKKTSGNMDSLAEMYFENLIGKSEKEVKEAGLESDDDMFYSALDGDVLVSCTDGVVDMIMITGNESNTPSFHGVRIGMAEEEAYAILSEAYPEDIGYLEGKCVANLDTKRMVRCNAEDGKISSICYLAMSDSEIEEYRQQKEASAVEFIFPDSNSRYLSEEEVRSVESDRLFIGRNEIFARHGYIFQDEGLQQHFNSMPWYLGTVTADQFDSEALFNDFEKKNVELIKRVEDEINGGGVSSEEFIGMTGIYVSTNRLGGSMSDYTGKIEITDIGEGAITFSLGILESPQYFLTENAQIINSNTAQIELYGFTITFTWTDGENVYVTHQGELTGMDSATIMDITNNQGYLRPYEFNKW